MLQQHHAAHITLSLMRPTVLNLKKITHFAPGGTVVMSSFEYPSYDKADNIQQINRTQNGTTQNLTYGYDNADRLTTVNDVASQLYEYGYDTADNTLTETRSGSLYHSYTFNNTLNQIDSGTIAFTYDKFGNLSKYGNKEYFYDGADRVNLINNPNINFKSQFVYDPLHRMIQIKESNLTTGATLSTTDFIWCGLKICARRLNGVVNRVDFPYGELRGSEKYFYTHDHLGSIRELTDSTGQIRAQFTYNPYGIPFKLAGDLDSSFRYTGQYSHVFSGLVLAPYRAYEPSLGRWLNRDPIGERGGVNLYGYVGDNPANRVDPLGLWALTVPGTLPEGGVSCLSCHNSWLNPPAPTSSLPAEARGHSDPIVLPIVNPGRDCNGKCNPCPQGARWWVNEPGHGHQNGYWHVIVYNQNPKTCDCHPDRPSSNLEGK